MNLFRFWDSELGTLAVIGAATVGLMYIGAPILGLSQTLKADPDDNSISLADLPDHARATLIGAAAPLAAVGFVAGSHSRVGMMQQTESHLSIWVHPEGIVAFCMVVRSTSGVATVTNTAVTLRTWFTDGTSIVTSNTKTASVFARDPKFDGVTWAGMDDLGRLVDFHRRRIANLKGTRQVRIYRPDQARELRQLEHDDSMRHQVIAGLWRLDSAARVYRKTIWGSFLMTWRLLPPLKQIRKKQAAARLNAALRSVGLQP